MNFVEFQKIVNKKKQENPFLFEEQHDQLATDANISKAEKELGVLFPKHYKEFLKTYGGGYFAYTNVFSVDENGEWYIINKNNKMYIPKDFVAISDDETGGLYGYKTDKIKCGEEIFYWDHDDQSVNKLYNSIFEYLIAVGLGEQF
jgi:hypothetical protein